MRSWTAALKQVVTFTVMFGVLVLLWLHFTMEPPSEHPIISDLGNLWEIGEKCRLYADHHAGIFPETWSLLDEYEILPSAFVVYTNRANAGSLSNVMEWSEYSYVSGLTTNAPTGTILAYGPIRTYHGEDVAAALLVDGNVKTVTSKEIKEIDRGLRTVVSTGVTVHGFSDGEK